MKQAKDKTGPIILRFILFITLLVITTGAPVNADEQPWTVHWKLTGDQINGSARNEFDEFGHESWFFLRTTTAEGPIQTRTWVHDGKYALLDQLSNRMFGVPLAGRAR